MLSQGSERQPITNAGTEPDPVTIPQGFDRSSAEVESIRSERDMLQGRLRQATEQAEAAKGNAAASEKKMLKMQKELEDDKKRLEGNAVASEEKMLKMQKEIEDKKKRLEEMELQVDISEERSRKTLKETKRENEKLRAELIRLRGKVWFYLRLRPKVDRDKENQYLDLTSPDDFHHSLNLPGGIDEKHPIDTHYEFDRVFHHTDTNHDVYEHVRPMVQAAMEGLDVAIILEGPSGSGKSYTMFEQPDGIAFSVARHILQLPSDGEGSSGQMQIRISNFKVYMENILDATISKGENPPLHVREEKDTKIQVYRDKRCAARVEGKLVSSKEQLTSEFVRILKAREQRETAQNATSSRSHAVCKLDFLSYNVEAGEARTSSLFLVDLAGPESYEQSPNPEETKNITKGRTELQHRLCEMIQLHQLDLSSPKRKEKTQALRLQLKNSKVIQPFQLDRHRKCLIAIAYPYPSRLFSGRAENSCYRNCQPVCGGRTPVTN